jgi:hypothetical protein
MSKGRNETGELTRAVVRMHAAVLALVCGVLGGGVVFVMTAWLVVKGGPQIGPHLRLLSEYFYGYTVTWKGSVVGCAYGAAVGSIVGWVIGAVYNRIVDLRQ